MWRHVNNQDKPAEHLSRGLMLSEIFETNLYWKGPSILNLQFENQIINLPDENDIPQRQLTVVSSIAIEDTVVDLNRFSVLQGLSELFLIIYG